MHALAGAHLRPEDRRDVHTRLLARDDLRGRKACGDRHTVFIQSLTCGQLAGASTHMQLPCACLMQRLGTAPRACRWGARLGERVERGDDGGEAVQLALGQHVRLVQQHKVRAPARHPASAWAAWTDGKAEPACSQRRSHGMACGQKRNVQACPQPGGAPLLLGSVLLLVQWRDMRQPQAVKDSVEGNQQFDSIWLPHQLAVHRQRFTPAKAWHCSLAGTRSFPATRLLTNGLSSKS